ncbi:MAG: hypothetical protein B7Y12_02190 [Rhizobiales bacterium 24-66-13]|nr:MAG: hypothetical protein B7Z41_03110 [Rhizobiales bacterium 12-66-7]OYY88844.1 MAG: hypothetical protein B7Y61_01220 [Rhizobiales bacterium 35-66-30]OYZ82833.1 MAG: hypothetical protein B7Y12_02190 [Rhizobiales bacterium 24-66-13]OZB11872.1 MAG: hypothetical protein B7X67_02170 [Rhizobiales bacterium 39-66-18]
MPPPDAAETRIEVWDCNWSTFRLFDACATQWRVVGGFGVMWIGLDYAAVEIVQRRLHLDDADFADLQAMEVEALMILNGGRS